MWLPRRVSPFVDNLSSLSFCFDIELQPLCFSLASVSSSLPPHLSKQQCGQKGWRLSCCTFKKSYLLTLHSHLTITAACLAPPSSLSPSISKT